MPDESKPQSVQPLERRLATILCADVAGYSEMMATNEELTVRVFRGHREIFESLVSLHRGRIFNTAGDALLAEFNSAVEAVRCATEIQAALRTRNEHLASEERMLFRVGINLGDVIVQGGDLLGDGVNVAARIQTATAPGGICISGSVHDQIQNKLSLNFKLLGEQTYKNIAKPVRTYTINEEGAVTTAGRRTGWRAPAAVTAAVLMIAGAGYWGYLQYDTHRAEQLQVDARLAAQLAAQKQATEQAQQAAEEAKREAQAQAQKLVANEGLRRVQEERTRVEQDRKLLDAERRAAEAAKRQAADEGLRRVQEERTQLEQERKRLDAEKQAAETAKRQAAADETLRRAQEERAQLEQERKRLDAEKQAAETARKQAETSQRVAAPVAVSEPKSSEHYDGTYYGRLCNYVKGEERCWTVTLLVKGGVVEATWLSRKKENKSTAKGTVTANGSVELKISAWTRQNIPTSTVLSGRVTGDGITASGHWPDGIPVSGNWKRMQTAPTAPVLTDVPKLVASYDGTYNGQFCNQVPNQPPHCWSVALAVRNGFVEGSWSNKSKKTSMVRGAVTADGSVQLTLDAWTENGTPASARLLGRIVDGAITASGKWGSGTPVSGNWKRSP
jgi:class 3 adenylate cyclase